MVFSLFSTSPSPADRIGLPQARPARALPPRHVAEVFLADHDTSSSDEEDIGDTRLRRSSGAMTPATDENRQTSTSVSSTASSATTCSNLSTQSLSETYWEDIDNAPPSWKRYFRRRKKVEFNGDQQTLPSTLTEEDKSRCSVVGVTPLLCQLVLQGLCPFPKTFIDYPFEDRNATDDDDGDGRFLTRPLRYRITPLGMEHIALVCKAVAPLELLCFQLCPAAMREVDFWRAYFHLVQSHTLQCGDGLGVDKFVEVVNSPSVERRIESENSTAPLTHSIGHVGASCDETVPPASTTAASDDFTLQDPFAKDQPRNTPRQTLTRATTTTKQAGPPARHPPQPAQEEPLKTSMVASAHRPVKVDSVNARKEMERQRSYRALEHEVKSQLVAAAKEREDLEVALEKEEEALMATFTCTITQDLMEDPVLAADGHTYERKAIEEWLNHNDTSPLNGDELQDLELTPNYAMRSAIQAFQERRQKRFLRSGRSWSSVMPDGEISHMSVEELSGRHTTKMLTEAKAILSEPTMVVRHRGYKRPKALMISFEDGVLKMSSAKAKSKDSKANVVEDVAAVVSGKTTKNFKRRTAKKADAGYCFSVLTASHGVFDFEATSTTTQCLWVKSLQLVLDDGRQQS